jgi:hypothetical protein
MMNSQEKLFLTYIKNNRSMGYGRMLQMVTHEWVRDCRRRGDPTSGVLVANTCLGFLPKDERQEIERHASKECCS